MHFTRLLLTCTSFMFAALADAEWTDLTPGSGNRSVTTFGGAIYVAAPPHGIRKSTDDGASWAMANTGLPEVVDESGTRVFAYSVGHSGTALFCGTQAGVYRSTDNGASWMSVGSGTLPASSGAVYAKKIFSFGGGVFLIYSGTVENNGGGVFRSYDNGTSWLAAYSGLSINMEVYNIDDHEGVLYASTSTSLMRSFDHGGSWQQVPGVNYTVRSVQGAYGQLVILGQNGAQRSSNNGQTWQSSTGYPTANCPAGSELIAYDGKFFAITKTGASGCYRSLDNGATWQSYNTGMDALATLAQEQFHATSDYLYIACPSTMLRTPGTSVAVEEERTQTLPLPFPTTFAEQFSLDLGGMNGLREVVLVDASGRAVLRKGISGGGLHRIERASLAAGRYHCMLLDPETGTILNLGQVIAQ